MARPSAEGPKASGDRHRRMIENNRATAFSKRRPRGSGRFVHKVFAPCSRSLEKFPRSFPYTSCRESFIRLASVASTAMSDSISSPPDQTKLVRFFAFVLCAMPAFFAVECLLIVFAVPAIQAMFADFGTRLPAMTEFVFEWRPAIAALAIAAVLVPALLYWSKGLCRGHVIAASAFGLFNFMLAQTALLGVLLPIFSLGAVSGGV